jgi:DNA-directed RNA polymerase subunit RPC12/RpoP
MAERESVTPMHCCRCSYDWFPRGSELPKRCPECRSIKWNSPNLLAECLRCGHKWNSHRGNPQRCPNCGSKCWNVPPKEHVCVRCGGRWTASNDRRPGKCPYCGSRYWDSEKDEPEKSSKGAQSKLGPEAESRIAELYAKGVPAVKISISLGIPFSLVQGVVRNLPVPDVSREDCP